MPFGLKKSSKEADSLDAQKSSLFGRNKASKSPAPQAANPYATPPPANDPYAQRNANPYASNAAQSDPYAPRSQSNLSQPPVSSISSLTLGSQASAPPNYSSQANLQPSPNRQQNYTTGAPKFSGGGSYGQTGGYGSDPYGGSAGQSRYGAGGYGGLGRKPSTDTMTTDAGRNALFGDAPARVAAQQQQQTQDNSYSNAGGYGQSDMPGGYGADRELTAEEEEEQNVQASKDEIRRLKGDTVSSLQRSLQAINGMEATGQATLGNLHRQGEMLNNTEKNLDYAAVQASRSKDKAQTLKRLNDRPFFIPENPTNPFASKEKRYNRQLEESAARHRVEKREREQTAANAYQSKARADQFQKDIRDVNKPMPKKSLADRARFQFEADEEDDAVEDEIDRDLDDVYAGVQRLNAIGRAMDTEISGQLKNLEKINDKADRVDDQVQGNTDRLAMIR
ncbi:hypothetical protein EJ03DRAFT_390742 [Teratosphaeria nubilosa]|uniref:t-SNARE coiled-coil homology domain-containing protein n=1 Tax=Teratosphaeria nubilosa TaxID=161662 RepID=A0A6G1L2G7_9PEZI|nr:hypothetical protein EJ03DRAFT_390742 [Teratosphaeria nubilosa]